VQALGTVLQIGKNRRKIEEIPEKPTKTKENLWKPGFFH